MGYKREYDSSNLYELNQQTYEDAQRELKERLAWENAPYNDHLKDMSRPYAGDPDYERYMMLKKQHEAALNQYYNGQESEGTSNQMESLNAYMSQQDRADYQRYLQQEYERFGHKNLNLSTVPEIEEQDGLSRLAEGEDIGSKLSPYFKASDKRDRAAFIRSKKEQLANIRQLETSINDIKKSPSVSDYLYRKEKLDSWHRARAGKEVPEDPYSSASSQPNLKEIKPFKFEQEKNKTPFGKQIFDTTNKWGKNVSHVSDATDVGRNFQSKMLKAPSGYTMWGDGLAMPKEGNGMTPLAYSHLREYHKNKTGEDLPDIQFANQNYTEEEKRKRIKEYEKYNKGNLISRDDLLAGIGQQVKQGRKKLEELEQAENVFRDGRYIPEINKYRKMYGTAQDDVYAKFHSFHEAKKMKDLITKTPEGLLKIGDVNKYENNYFGRLNDLMLTAAKTSGNSALMKEVADRIEAEVNDNSWYGRHKKLIHSTLKSIINPFAGAKDIYDWLTEEEEHFDSTRKHLETLKSMKLYSDYVDPKKLGISDDIEEMDFYEVANNVTREFTDKAASLGQVVPDWMQNISKVGNPLYYYFPQEDVTINGEGVKSYSRRFAITGLFKDPVEFLSNKYAEDKDIKEMLAARFEGDKNIREILSDRSFIMDAASMVGEITGSFTPAGPLGIGSKVASGLANGARRWKKAATYLDKWDEARDYYKTVGRLAETSIKDGVPIAISRFLTPNAYNIVEASAKTAMTFGVANIIESIDEGNINMKEVGNAFVKGGAMGFVGGLLGATAAKIGVRAYTAARIGQNLGINMEKARMIAQGANVLAQIPANIAQSLVNKVLTEGWDGVMSYTARQAALDALVGAVFSLNDLNDAIESNKILRSSGFDKAVQDVINILQKQKAVNEASEKIKSVGQGLGDGTQTEGFGISNEPTEIKTEMDEAAEKIVDIADEVEEFLKNAKEMFNGVDPEEESKVMAEEREPIIEENAAEPGQPKYISDKFKENVDEKGNQKPINFRDFRDAIPEVAQDEVVNELFSLNEAINDADLEVIIDKTDPVPHYNAKNNNIVIPDLEYTDTNIALLVGILREEVAHAVTIKRLRTSPGFEEKINEIWDEVHAIAANSDFWVDAYNTHVQKMGFAPGEQPTFSEYVKTIADYYLGYKKGKDGSPERDLIEFIGGLFNRQSGFQEAMKKHKSKLLGKLIKRGKGEKVYNDLIKTVFDLSVGKPKTGKVVAKKKETAYEKFQRESAAQEKIDFESEENYDIETVPGKEETKASMEETPTMESGNPAYEQTQNQEAQTGAEPAPQETQQTKDVDVTDPSLYEQKQEEGVDSFDADELFSASPQTIAAKIKPSVAKDEKLSKTDVIDRIIQEEKAIREAKSKERSKVITGKTPYIAYNQARVFYTQVIEEGVMNHYTGTSEPVEGSEWAAIKMSVNGDPEKVIHMYDVVKGQWYRYTPSPIKARFVHEMGAGTLERITKEQASMFVPPHGIGGQFETNREKYLEGATREARGVYPDTHPNRVQDFYVSSKVFEGLDNASIDPETMFANAMNELEYMAKRTLMDVAGIPFTGQKIEFNKEDEAYFKELTNTVVTPEEELVTTNGNIVTVDDIITKVDKQGRVLQNLTFRPNANPGKILAYRHDANKFSYTQGQAAALLAVEDLLRADGSGVFRVIGYAGTGKTTILENINRFALEEGYEVFNLAPTGAAVQNMIGRAKEIKDVKGMPSIRKVEYATVASYLGYSMDKDTGEYYVGAKNRKNDNARMLVIDESSMLNTEDFEGLIEAMASEDKIVFMGDGYQNEAVESNEGETINVMSLNDPLFGEKNFVMLTEVMRVGPENSVTTVANAQRIMGSPIFPKESTKDILMYPAGNPHEEDINKAVSEGSFIRKGSFVYELHQYADQQFVENFVERYRENPSETMMVVYSNKERVQRNKEARAMLYPGVPFDQIQPGEKIVFLSNNKRYGIANGLTDTFSPENMSIDYSKVYRIRQTKQRPDEEDTFANVYKGTYYYKELKPGATSVETTAVPIIFSPDWAEATLSFQGIANRGSAAKARNLPTYDPEAERMERDFFAERFGNVYVRSQDGKTFNTPDEIKRDERQIAGVTYGMVLTGHKAQGSQAKDVFVSIPLWTTSVVKTLNDIAEGKMVNATTAKTAIRFAKWVYTAMTRTSEKVHILNSSIPFMPIEKISDLVKEANRQSRLQYSGRAKDRQEDESIKLAIQKAKSVAEEYSKYMANEAFKNTEAEIHGKIELISRIINRSGNPVKLEREAFSALEKVTEDVDLTSSEKLDTMLRILEQFAKKKDLGYQFFKNDLQKASAFIEGRLDKANSESVPPIAQYLKNIGGFSSGRELTAFMESVLITNPNEFTAVVKEYFAGHLQRERATEDVYDKVDKFIRQWYFNNHYKVPIKTGTARFILSKNKGKKIEFGGVQIGEGTKTTPRLAIGAIALGLLKQSPSAKLGRNTTHGGGALVKLLDMMATQAAEEKMTPDSSPIISIENIEYVDDAKITSQTKLWDSSSEYLVPDVAKELFKEGIILLGKSNSEKFALNAKSVFLQLHRNIGSYISANSDKASKDFAYSEIIRFVAEMTDELLWNALNRPSTWSNIAEHKSMFPTDISNLATYISPVKLHASNFNAVGSLNPQEILLKEHFGNEALIKKLEDPELQGRLLAMKNKIKSIFNWPGFPRNLTPVERMIVGKDKFKIDDIFEVVRDVTYGYLSLLTEPGIQSPFMKNMQSEDPDGFETVKLPKLSNKYLGVTYGEYKTIKNLQALLNILPDQYKNFKEEDWLAKDIFYNEELGHFYKHVIADFDGMMGVLERSELPEVVKSKYMSIAFRFTERNNDGGTFVVSKGLSEVQRDLYGADELGQNKYGLVYVDSKGNTTINKTESHANLLSGKFGTPELENIVRNLRGSKIGMISPTSAIKSNGFIYPDEFQLEDGTIVYLNHQRQVVGYSKDNGTTIKASKQDIDEFVLPYYLDFLDGNGLIPWNVLEVPMYGNNSPRYVSMNEIKKGENNELGHLGLPSYVPGHKYYEESHEMFDKLLSNIQHKAARFAKAYADLLSNNVHSLDKPARKRIGDLLEKMARYYEKKQINPDEFVAVDDAYELPLVLRKSINSDGEFMPETRDALFLNARFSFGEAISESAFKEGTIPSDLARVLGDELEDAWKHRIEMLNTPVVPDIDTKGDYMRIIEVGTEALAKDILNKSELEYYYRKHIGDPNQPTETHPVTQEVVKEAMMKDMQEKLSLIEQSIDPVLGVWKDGTPYQSVGRKTYDFLLKKAQERNPYVRSLIGEPIILKTTPSDSPSGFAPMVIGGVMDIDHGMTTNKYLLLNLLGKDFDGDRASLVYPSNSFDSRDDDGNITEANPFLEMHEKLTDMGVVSGAFKDEWEAQTMKKITMIKDGTSKANTSIVYPNGNTVAVKKPSSNPLWPGYAGAVINSTVGVASAVQKVKRWTDAMSTLKNMPEGKHVLMTDKETKADKITVTKKSNDYVEVVVATKKGRLYFQVDLNPEYQQRISGLYKQLFGVDKYTDSTLDGDDLWYGSKFIEIRKETGFGENKYWKVEDWGTLPGELRNGYTVAFDRFVNALRSPEYNKMAELYDNDEGYNNEIRFNGDTHSMFWKHLSAMGPVQRPLNKYKKQIEIRQKIETVANEKLSKTPKALEKLKSQVKIAFGGGDEVTDTPFTWLFDSIATFSHRINYFGNNNLYMDQVVKESIDPKYIDGQLLLASYGVLWEKMFSIDASAKHLEGIKRTNLSFLNPVGSQKEFMYAKNNTAVYFLDKGESIPIRELINKNTGKPNQRVWEYFLGKAEGDVNLALGKMGAFYQAVTKDMSPILGKMKVGSTEKSYLLGKIMGRASLALESLNKPADVFAGLYALSPMPENMTPKGGKGVVYKGVLSMPYIGARDKDSNIPDNIARISWDEVLKGIASENVRAIVPFAGDNTTIPVKDFVFDSLKETPEDEDIHGASFSTFIRGSKYKKEMKGKTGEGIADYLKSSKFKDVSAKDLTLMANEAEASIGSFLEQTTMDPEKIKSLRNQVTTDFAMALAELDSQYKGGTLRSLATIYSKLRRTDKNALAHALGEKSYYPGNFILAASAEVSLREGQVFKKPMNTVVASTVQENTRLLRVGGAALTKAETYTTMIENVAKTLEYAQNIGAENAEDIFYKTNNNEELNKMAAGLMPEGNEDIIRSQFMNGFTMGKVKFVDGLYNGKNKANLSMEVGGETFAFGDWGARLDKAIQRSIRTYANGEQISRDISNEIAEIKRYIKLSHFRGVVGLSYESLRAAITQFSSLRSFSPETKRRLSELEKSLAEEVEVLLNPDIRHAIDASRKVVKKEAALDKLKDRMILLNEQGAFHREQFMFELGKKIHNSDVLYEDVDDFDRAAFKAAGEIAIGETFEYLRKELDISVWNGSQKAKSSQKNVNQIYKYLDLLGLAEHVEYRPEAYAEKLEAQSKYLQAIVEDIFLSEYMKDPEKNLFAHVAAVAAINKMSQTSKLFTAPVDYMSWGEAPTPIKPGSQIKGFALNKNGTSDRYSGRFIRNVNGFALIYNENTQRLFAIHRDALQNMFIAEQVPYTFESGDKAVVDAYTERFDKVGEEFEKNFKSLVAKQNSRMGKLKAKDNLASMVMDITDVVELNNQSAWRTMKDLSVFLTHWWNYGSGKFLVRGVGSIGASMYFAASGQMGAATAAAATGVTLMAAPVIRNAVKAQLNKLSSARAAMSERGSIGFNYLKKQKTDPNESTLSQEKTKEKNDEIVNLGKDSMRSMLRRNQYNSAAEADQEFEKVELKDIPRVGREFLEGARTAKEIAEVKRELYKAKEEGIRELPAMMQAISKNAQEIIKNKGYKVVKVEGGFKIVNADGTQPLEKDDVIVKLTSFMSNLFGMTMLAESEIEAGNTATFINANMLIANNPDLTEIDLAASESILEAYNRIAVGNYGLNTWTSQKTARYFNMYSNFKKEFSLATIGDLAKKMITWNDMIDYLEKAPWVKAAFAEKNVDTVGLKFKNPYSTARNVMAWSAVSQSYRIMSLLLRFLSSGAVAGAAGMWFLLMEDDYKKLGYTGGVSGYIYSLFVNVGIFASQDSKTFKDNAKDAYKARKEVSDEHLGLGEKAAFNIVNILLDAAIYKAAHQEPSKTVQKMQEKDLVNAIGTIPYVGPAIDTYKSSTNIKEKE